MQSKGLEEYHILDVMSKYADEVEAIMERILKEEAAEEKRQVRGRKILGDIEKLNSLFEAVENSREAYDNTDLIDCSNEPSLLKLSDVMETYDVTKEEVFLAVQRELDIGELCFDGECFFPFI
jgi:hypothetical protein